MNFTIDAKANYVLINTEGAILDKEMAIALKDKINELLNNQGKNFIINLQAQKDMDFQAGAVLMDLHHSLYETGHSLVFTNLQENVLQKMKKEQLHLSLNLSPTLIEAIDIINMEIVERDIFNES